MTLAMLLPRKFLAAVGGGGGGGAVRLGLALLSSGPSNLSNGADGSIRPRPPAIDADHRL
jgi:hypothetical protein